MRLALAITVLATLLLGVAAAQQSGANAPSDQRARSQSPEPSSLYQKPMQRLNLSVFSGRVVKDHTRKYFLVNGITGMRYLLDSQKLAAKYNGKEVDVEGTAVPPGLVLHVKKIEDFE